MVFLLAFFSSAWQKWASTFRTSRPTECISSAIPPSGWWSCCPLCTSPGTGASQPNVCPMPRPPATRLSTVCCGSSTGRSWLVSSAGFWERISTRSPSTARAARWTPQMTTVLPELPELDVQIFKWFNTCAPSAGGSEVREQPCRWKGVSALLKDTLTQGWTTGLFKPPCCPLGELWRTQNNVCWCVPKAFQTLQTAVSSGLASLPAEALPRIHHTMFITIFNVNAWFEVTLNCDQWTSWKNWKKMSTHCFEANIKVCINERHFNTESVKIGMRKCEDVMPQMKE